MPDLSAVFSLSGLVCFAAGVGVTVLYHHIKNNWLDRNRPNADGSLHTGGRVQVIWIVWAAIILTIGFIGYQTQRTYDFTKELAVSTKDCQNQFNAALAARSAATTSSDAIVTTELQALHTWIQSLLSPPPNIAALPPNDPERQAWGLGITLQYNNTVNAAEAQRAAMDAQRAAHPLTQPKCG